MPYLSIRVSLEGKEGGWKQLQKLNIERECWFGFPPDGKGMKRQTAVFETQNAYFPWFT